MEQQGKASTRAKDKYNAANYDQVKLWVKKGDKERIEAAAKAADMSRNAFILEAVEEKINHQVKEPSQD